MLRWIRALAHSVGVELTRYTPDNYTHLRRAAILRSGDVDVLLDAGAHDGSWGRQARASGFRGRIESFEPQSRSFERLARRAAADASWNVHRLALSDHAGDETLYLSPHAQSSSLMPLGLQERIDPRFAYTGFEIVSTQTLDALDLVCAYESAYLKVDVQGHELPVLHGAVQTVENRCHVVELELSFVPLYTGQALAPELMTWLAERAFVLASIEVSWRHPATGDVLEANGIFSRLTERAV
jgi:FkbM family methyltransferase